MGIKENLNRYRAKHPEKVSEWNRRWRLKHPEKAKAAHNSLASQWYNLRRNAECRGLPVEITKEEFAKMVVMPCTYGIGSTVVPEHIGVDRIDNKKGYLTDNCQPCCSRHNEMRNNWFSHEEMLIIVGCIESAKNCGESRHGGVKDERSER